MGVNVQLQNVTVDGDWIEGDIDIEIDELGSNVSKTTHFKTKKDLQQDGPRGWI
ncbi:hypothetical protein [Mesorhizobium sp. B1-1-5]|uniref:hypothetical protein n=1 Tax=Mesorhizobium sp. B1-1-5 TaxID=2589979 RepID=UPI0015E39320|nr:hypothetical protein [Mesorhizobium sp. B1-1-5]